jgi:hypothetical protein
MKSIYVEFFITMFWLFCMWSALDLFRKSKEKWRWHSNLFSSTYMAFLITVQKRLELSWYKMIPIVIVIVVLLEGIYHSSIQIKPKGDTDGSGTHHGS